MRGRRRGPGGDLSFEVKGAGGKCEGEAIATQCVPGSLPNERVGVVILGVILQPVLYFPFNRGVAEIPDAHNRSNFLRHVVSVAHRFAHDMNCLSRRVGIDRAEVHQARVQIVTRGYLDSFFRRDAVAHQHDVILKSAELNGAPINALDDSGVFLLTHDDHVPDLKWTVCVQGDAGEEISQCVLQRQADDHAKDCRGREERAEINFAVNVLEDQNKKNCERNHRKDVAHQSGSFVAAANPKYKIKGDAIQRAHAEEGENGPQDELGNPDQAVLDSVAGEPRAEVSS